MSEKLNPAIAVIGIDIGKNSFHVVGLDRRGAIMLRQKWSRGQVGTRLATMPRCLIGPSMYPCSRSPSRKIPMNGVASICVVPDRYPSKGLLEGTSHPPLSMVLRDTPVNYSFFGQPKWPGRRV